MEDKSTKFEMIVFSSFPSLITSTILFPLSRIKIIQQTSGLIFKSEVKPNFNQLIFSKIINFNY